MRASRETELAGEYPLHVVTAWLGNTPRIALKHYLQVTDEDFRRASQGGAQSGARLAQNAAQHPHAGNRNEQQETKQAPAGQGLVRRNAATCQNMQVTQVAGTGFELLVRFRGKTYVLTKAGDQLGIISEKARS